MPETAYRLSISAELEPYRSEIEFSCDFLDACYDVRRMPNAPKVLHYGAGAPSDSIAVPAVLFPFGVRTDEEGIHPVRSTLKAMAGEGGGLVRPEHAGAMKAPFRYDPLGLIFFMLSRIEERDHPDRDRYGRFPVGAALLQPVNGRLEPFADRITLGQRDRDASIRPWVERYAARLEHHCRDAPYNWFNFYDFWPAPHA